MDEAARAEATGPEATGANATGTDATCANASGRDDSGPSGRTVKAPDERRAEVLAAARALFAEQGVARTSISDVAARVGVTRGLVHHYVGTKDALVEEVLEGYIEEFVDAIREWDAHREVGNIDKALADSVTLFRSHLQGRGGLRTDYPRIDDAGLYVRFVDRAVDAMVECLRDTTVRAYAERHQIEIEHVDQTFTVLIHGLIGLARSRPQTSDDVLAGIIRQTLRLEAGDGRPDGTVAGDGRPAPDPSNPQHDPRGE
ncbi:MAG: TetR/AcrR family transcriptional regulator [Cellulomonadaceae bacterium]|nr:TetR/AcrR family transcriptional regulator [Cellulomonadaceae bacterium]